MGKCRWHDGPVKSVQVLQLCAQSIGHSARIEWRAATSVCETDWEGGISRRRATDKWRTVPSSRHRTDTAVMIACANPFVPVSVRICVGAAMLGTNSGGYFPFSRGSSLVSTIYSVSLRAASVMLVGVAVVSVRTAITALVTSLPPLRLIHTDCTV
jgi:hypothetical protein